MLEGGWFMKIDQKARGFTLLELMLVITIIAVLVAALMPVFKKAQTNSKYTQCKENCVLVASYAEQWAEHAIASQDERGSTATLADYYATLAGATAAPAAAGTALPGKWIAEDLPDTNWKMDWDVATQARSIDGLEPDGRYVDGQTGAAAEIQSVVQDYVPPEKEVLNPFNGVSVFTTEENDPQTVGTVVPGAIACGGVAKQNSRSYYALVFQGTDSSTIDVATETSFHGGMHSQNLEGLKEGPTLREF